MAILTAKHKGGIISVETAVKMKAAAKRAGEKPQEIHCDKCGWRVFVQEERNTETGKVIPAFFQHCPGHPFCQYTKTDRQTKRGDRDARRVVLNQFLQALIDLYQFSSRLVFNCGESVQELKVQLSEMQGWRNEPTFALVKKNSPFDDHTCLLGVRQSLANQGAILRENVYEVLSLIAQTEGPVPVAYLSKRIEILLRVVEETNLRIEIGQSITGNIFPSPQEKKLRIYRKYQHYVQKAITDLAHSVHYYHGTSSVQSGSYLYHFERERIRELERRCAMLQSELEQVQQTVSELREGLVPIPTLPPCDPKRGYDAKYFAGLCNRGEANIREHMNTFEANTSASFEVGARRRKYTYNPLVAQRFKTYLDNNMRNLKH